MPHEITETDQVISGHGETPWHQIGVVQPGTVTLDEARRVVCPWEPELTPVYVKDGQRYVEIPDTRATRRPDTREVLGIMTEDYGLFPNQAGFDFAGQILEQGDGEVEVETAGTLKGGRWVWVLCWLNRELDVNGDRFDPYLLVRWGHDGRTALEALNTRIRVVCRNTWNAATAQAVRRWAASHSQSIEERAGEARHVLRMVDDYDALFRAEVERLQSIRITTSDFTDQFVPMIFPVGDDASERTQRGVARRRDAVVDLWLTDDRVAPWTNTGWGAVQAVSTWEEHMRPVRGERAERRAIRALDDRSTTFTARARELVLS